MHHRFAFLTSAAMNSLHRHRTLPSRNVNSILNQSDQSQPLK